MWFVDGYFGGAPREQSIGHVESTRYADGFVCYGISTLRRLQRLSAVSVSLCFTAGFPRSRDRAAMISEANLDVVKRVGGTRL